MLNDIPTEERIVVLDERKHAFPIRLVAARPVLKLTENEYIKGASSRSQIYLSPTSASIYLLIKLLMRW